MLSVVITGVSAGACRNSSIPDKFLTADEIPQIRVERQTDKFTGILVFTCPKTQTGVRDFQMGESKLSGSLLFWGGSF